MQGLSVRSLLNIKRKPASTYFPLIRSQERFVSQGRQSTWSTAREPAARLLHISRFYLDVNTALALGRDRYPTLPPAKLHTRGVIRFLLSFQRAGPDLISTPAQTEAVPTYIICVTETKINPSSQRKSLIAANSKAAKGNFYFFFYFFMLAWHRSSLFVPTPH